MEFIVKKNEEITDEILDKVLEFDRTIFPEDEDYAFPDGYFRDLYKNNKEGMFVLVDNLNNVYGYVNLIFISKKGKDEFLKNREYLKLEHIGFKKGKNIVYLYNLLIHESLRNGIYIIMIMKEICKWLYEEKENGKIIDYIFSEAVTEDGVKTLMAMEMSPLDIDDEKMGIYYSKDNLEKYILKMIN